MTSDREKVGHAVCCSAALSSSSLFSFSSFMAAIELITLYAWVVPPPHIHVQEGEEMQRRNCVRSLSTGVVQMEVMVEVLPFELCKHS